MRVVFDTNVLLSAFLTEGICSKLLIRARRKEFNLVTCPFILKEVERTLKKKFLAAPSEVRDVMDLIADATHLVVESVQVVPRVCRDQDDDQVLACASEAKADYLVTGDSDLLVLKKYIKTQIIAPREFEMLFRD
jgi:putative PIN family toxin of toxin-antitoxin system